MLLRDGDNDEVVRLKTKFLQGLYKFMKEMKVQIEYVHHIFNLLRKDPSDIKIKVKDITDQFKKMGIMFDDPRIERMIKYF